MPVTPTYPGVYIEEIPSGVRTITGVATSVAAFVDFFKRGPMNKAVQIFNMADFQREFGGLDTRSEASYAIQQFFLNGGTEAWIVRVASPDLSDPNNPQPAATAFVPILSTAPGPSLDVRAANEGVWGNRLRVGVDYDSTDPATRFNLTVSEVDDVSGRTVVVRQERFRNLTMVASDTMFVNAVVDRGSRLITVEAASGELPAASGTLSGPLVAPNQPFQVVPPPVPTDPLKVGVTLTVGLAVDGPTDASLGTGAISTLDEAAGRLEAAIRNANPGKPAWSQTTVRAVAGRLQVVAGDERGVSGARGEWGGWCATRCDGDGG